MSPANTRKEIARITSLVEDIGDLRAFGLVVDLQSVTAAAAVLGESKATTSRRITRMEAALGVALVTRTSRMVEVTEEGRAYRQRIGEVLELLADANAGVRNAHQPPHGQLKIAVPTDLNRVVVPLITSFLQLHPLVTTLIVPYAAGLDLEYERIDLAFRPGQRPHAGAFEVTELAELRLITVAAPGYLAHHHTLASPTELAHHRVLLHSHAMDRDLVFVDRAGGRSQEVRLQPAIAASDPGLLIEAALAGAGVALVPELFVRREVQRGQLVHVMPSYAIPAGRLGMLARTGQFVPAKITAFRDFVREQLRGA